MPPDNISYSRIFSPSPFGEALLLISGAEEASWGGETTDLPTFTPTG